MEIREPKMASNKKQNKKVNSKHHEINYLHQKKNFNLKETIQNASKTCISKLLKILSQQFF